METVLITGGTGLIGKALGQALLKKGYSVIILTRDPGKKPVSDPGLTYGGWNVTGQSIDANVVSSADHIIHLAGAGIADKRWSQKRKQEIVNSRVQSSKLIVDSLQDIPNKVKTVISVSAIGYYGPDPVIPNPEPFVETAPFHNDFLGTTCQQWEESIRPVQQQGKRSVILRTGPVLSKEGGMLDKFKMPLRFGLAAILGKGNQVVSWIHIDDLVSIFIAAIENEKLNGVYNAVAPNPVSNKEIILQAAGARKKFFIPFHVPSFLLKIFFGELSNEVLKSCTVNACKIENTGFQFRFPSINTALADLK